MRNNPEEEQAIKRLVEQIVRLDVEIEMLLGNDDYGASASRRDESDGLEDDLETLYGATLNGDNEELIYVWRDGSIYAVLNTVAWTWLTEQEIQELSA